MKIFWSPLAVSRLEEIDEHISIDDLSAAQKLIEKIFKRVETLSKSPRRGRVVPEANLKEIREIFVSDYRIIYRVEEKEIYILTIRNFKQLLSNGELK